MFRRILIANRGEIAVRIIRACRLAGAETVAVYSEADGDSLHVQMADHAVSIGPAAARDSYLNLPSIIAAARLSNADAIHPGYGLLSENPAFPELCQQYGISFIGPSASIIREMGDKVAARSAAARMGLPLLSGSRSEMTDDVVAHAREIGFPVLIKAVAGGGGRGMVRVDEEGRLAAAVSHARTEAEAAFGDGRVYIERFLPSARHVEVQIIGDGRGHVVHLGERDCTVQRRHQKLLEEAPSASLTASLREALWEAAVKLAAGVRFMGLGTVEFLVDVSREEFFFIEMNTRVQVEHPVSEMITGIDIVEEQIRLAATGELSFGQEDVEFAGHSIECRINADDPERGFAPCPGRITKFIPPGGPAVRCDTHCYDNYVVPPHYDSLLAKIIVHGRDRDHAILLMDAALASARIEGIGNTISLHRSILADPSFRADRLHTRWLEENFLPAHQQAVGSLKEDASTRSLACP